MVRWLCCARWSSGDLLLMRWRLSGSTWELAPSLVTLARQVNEAYPLSHVADGTLGNASHSARTSDHNPDDNRIVHAIDIGEVVEDDAFDVAESIRLSRDPRVKYVIHEAKMFSSYAWKGIPAFTWREYTGVNLHWSHVHVSVWTKNENIMVAWDIGRGGEDMAILSTDEQKELQQFLADLVSVKSNVGFVKYLIPWYRRWRNFSPLQFLKRGDKVEIH